MEARRALGLAWPAGCGAPCRAAPDVLREHAKQFCLQTGMHGYKYIAQPGKHSAERWFWLVAVTVAMGAAVYSMAVAYAFNRDHLTLLAVDTTHYPLWRVHVPAVTVCPSNKVLLSKARRLAKGMRLPAGVTADDVLEDMAGLVELVLPRALNASRFERLQRILDANKLSVDEVMWAVSPSCDELLVKCQWKRRNCAQCSDLFRKVRTSYGYCCSFNYMDREIDTIKRYERPGGCQGPSPRSVQRVSACGPTNGLSVAVHVQAENYFASLVPSYSVILLLHSALQFPDESAHTKVIGKNSVTLISYIAEVTEGTDRLRNSLSAEERKCLFPDETYLPMYRNITFGNCMASCKANKTIEVCGCVPLTFPHVLNRTICTLMDIPCQSALFFATKSSAPPRCRRQDDAASQELNNSASCPPAPSSPAAHKPLNPSNCPRCRPMCQHVRYIVKSSSGRLNWTTDAGNFFMGNTSGLDSSNYAVVHVYARRGVTTRYKMDRHMLREDLLGSLGGLSGLFIGFSLVAGFECVYFFTIRPCFRGGGPGGELEAEGRSVRDAATSPIASLVPRRPRQQQPNSNPWSPRGTELPAWPLAEPGPVSRLSPLVLAPPRVFAVRLRRGGAADGHGGLPVPPQRD